MRKTLLFFTLFLMFIFQNELKAQVWEPVGNPSGISSGGVGRLTLVNDVNDNLYVGYYDTDVMKGSVQKFNGTDWEYVGGQGITTDYVLFNSLSVNSAGVPYFFNQAAWPESGHEARVFQNGMWNVLPKVTNQSINYNSSTFSTNDVLFVSNNENGGTVKKLSGGQWVQVGNSGFAGGVPLYLDMVSGSDGKVYVSFNSDSHVRVMVNDENASSTQAWQHVGDNSELAWAADSEFYNSSLAIDANNNIYVAYVSRTNAGNKLNVKKFDGESWQQLGQENFTQGRVQHVSIAVGANNIVYVAASNWEDDNFLKNYVMAYDESANTWSQAGTGFASVGEATFNSLEVDNSGNLYLAFSDSELGKLSVKKLNLELTAAESVEISTQNNVDPIIDTDNGSLQLSAEVFPDEANQNVIWSIEEGETFATVDQNGLVTAIASNATIIVKAAAAENVSIFDTFEIIITNQQSEVAAQSIHISTLNDVYPDIFELGETLQLLATTSPAEADQYVTWSVLQGGEIVNVDQNGLVTGIAEGTAIISALHEDGILHDEIRVHVWENGCSQGHESMIFGFGYDITNGGVKGADDFVVEQGVNFELGTVRLSIISDANVDLNSFDLKFFKNKNGNMPGQEIVTIENLVPVSQEFKVDWDFGLYQYWVELNLPETINFTEGIYWMQPIATAENGSTVYWDVTVYGNIGGDYKMDHLEGNGWVSGGDGGFDGVFELTGNCTPMPVHITVVDGQDETIEVNESIQLQALVNGTENQNVNWTITEGTEFISIDDNGLVTGEQIGVATVRATSGFNSSYDEIEITVVSSDACIQEVLGSGHEEGYYTSGTKLAVDIDVPAENQFVISHVKPITVNFSTYFEFKFYHDENGLPGEEFQSVNGTIVDDISTGHWSGTSYWGHEYTVELAQQITLPSGKYWMEIITDAVALESSTENVLGLPSAMYNGVNWSYSPTASDFVYKLLGECGGFLESVELNVFDFTYYPNPVKDELFFNSQKQVQTIEIFNLAGQRIKNQTIKLNKGSISTSDLPAGIYMFRATLENGQLETFNIIKK